MTRLITDTVVVSAIVLYLFLAYTSPVWITIMLSMMIFGHH